jgi:hypothetical protein
VVVGISGTKADTGVPHSSGLALEALPRETAAGLLPKPLGLVRSLSSSPPVDFDGIHSNEKKNQSKSRLRLLSF